MEPPDELATLIESAKGWHKIQLAVLGFIGFCGVLWATGEPAGPRWLQWLAAGLAVLSLALAGLAIYLVGRVAYPFQGPATGPLPEPGTGARRLRSGVRTTYAAVAVLAIGTMSAWWPEPAATGGGDVEVRDAFGRTWCGALVGGSPGTVRIETASDAVTVPLDGVASLRPVESCGD